MPDITTEDDVVVHEGDRAFNYYDHKPGVIGRIESYPQPYVSRGQNSETPMDQWNNYWFEFQHDDGTSAYLDGSRICSTQFAIRKGWVQPHDD